MEDEVIIGWAEFERRARRKFSHGQRRCMLEAGVYCRRLAGQPPKRHWIVEANWTIYRLFWRKTKGTLIS